MKISNTYISGKLDQIDSEKNFILINPANEKEYGVLQCSSFDQVNEAINTTINNEKAAAELSLETRINILQTIYDQINKRKNELAEAMTLEMGVPITFSKNAQVKMGADHLVNTINTLQEFNFEESFDGYKVIKMPIGATALITPWNWPLNQTLTKIASAIGAGCSIILKPSEYSPVSSQILIDIIDKSPLPKGCFNCVNGIGSEIGPIISEHPHIKMISFTGSTRAGIDIQKRSANSVKRVSLELGGKSAHIICNGVELAKAIPNAINQCFINSGQSCSAPTRLLVPEDSIDQVKKIAAEHVDTLNFNYPKMEDTTHGPVVNKNQYESIQNYIQAGINEGCELLIGGLGRPDSFEDGFFVKPTIFVNVNNESIIAQDEIFGPVLAIISYKDIDEAINLANNSKYGLSSYVTCEDEKLAEDIAKRIYSGQTVINKASRGSVPAPFGGFKMSGNGREHGKFGLEEYLEIKAII